MTIKLYDLAADFKKVSELIDNEEIDPEVLQDTLQSIEGAIEIKAVNIATLVQGLSADADIIKAEEKRLAARRKAIEGKQKWLKDYLQSQMEYAGIDIKTATHTIALQKNPPALFIEDDKAIPSQYMTLIPERWEVDNAKVKEALKAGRKVPGAELRQGKSLRIR